MMDIYTRIGLLTNNTTTNSLHSTMNNITINMQEILGNGYAEFINSKHRYRCIKGSRGSKKSKDVALSYINGIMETAKNIEDDAKANLIVVRKRLNTHRDSTRADLIWAIRRLKVEKLWKYSPGDSGELTLTYKPTGQKIFFRGFDDPLNITSFAVTVGVLCWVWFEEAFQIEKESDFDKVDLSIRGKISPKLWKQVTLTFNAWSDKHWMKKRFFDKCDDVNITEQELIEFETGKRTSINKYATNEEEGILVGTTIYAQNEWLDEEDYKVFNRIRTNNPRRFLVEGLGCWGISEGLVFENWTSMEFDYKEIIRKSLDINGKTKLKIRFGLDFGYTNDVAALIACIVDEERSTIYIFKEFYKEGQTNRDLATHIKYMGYEKELIRCDSAEPKSIDELKYYGIHRATAAKKGPDSVRQGISRLRDYKLIVHPDCDNTLIELNNYVWAKDKKTEKLLNEPEDSYNHLMDALRYATEGIQTTSFRF